MVGMFPQYVRPVWQMVSRPYRSLGHRAVLLCVVFLAALLLPAADLSAEDITAQPQVPQIISELELDNAPIGRTDYYFEIGTRGSGTPMLVPVIVLKGEKPGKRLLLTAAVHGDELNGIAVIHQLLKRLDLNTLAGTVVLVPGVNPTGIEAHSRFVQMQENGGSMGDLNRAMPGVGSGRAGGVGALTHLAASFWKGIVKGRVDMAIDLHTQSRGAAYPLFVFADFRVPEIRQLAYDLNPEVIKNDPGQRGTLETALVSEDIPAVTFEIGAPKQFQTDLVNRATNGIVNVMRRHKMVPGSVESRTNRPPVGRTVSNISAKQGGFAHIQVKLMQQVKKGDILAYMVDSFGNELNVYKAPRDGIVLAVATDPVRERGSMLVRLLR